MGGACWRPARRLQGGQLSFLSLLTSRVSDGTPMYGSTPSPMLFSLLFPLLVRSHTHTLFHAHGCLDQDDVAARPSHGCKSWAGLWLSAVIWLSLPRAQLLLPRSRDCYCFERSS